MLPLRGRVDLEAMAMKGYSTFLKAPALLESHHPIVQCHIQDTRWEVVLLLCRDAVGVFYNPIWLGKTVWRFPRVWMSIWWQCWGFEKIWMNPVVVMKVQQPRSFTLFILTSEIIGENQAVIDNDSCKSIRSIARNTDVSEAGSAWRHSAGNALRD